MSKYALLITREYLFSPELLSNRGKERFIWFTRFLGALVIMNALDGAFTLFWILTNRAVEANPIMALALSVHPAMFMVVKMALVNMGAVLLLKFCYKSLASISLAVALCTYWLIILYHWTMVCVLHIL